MPRFDTGGTLISSTTIRIILPPVYSDSEPLKLTVGASSSSSYAKGNFIQPTEATKTVWTVEEFLSPQDQYREDGLRFEQGRCDTNRVLIFSWMGSVPAYGMRQL